MPALWFASASLGLRLGTQHQRPRQTTKKNVFGKAFDNVGAQWTRTLCRADSDGDGFSNGFELGDPDCTWVKGAQPFRIDTISHPGFADSTPIFIPATPTVAPAAIPAISPGVVVTPSQTKTTGIGMTYSWTLVLGDLATTADDVIELTMAATADTYVALGVSPSLMTGPIVACYVPRSGAAATCTDWTGAGLAAYAKTPAVSTLKSAAVAGSGFTVTVRCKVTDLGIRPFTSQRVIVAVGSFASNTLGQHSGAGRAAVTENFYSVLSNVGFVPVIAATTTPTAALLAQVPLPPSAVAVVRSPAFSGAAGAMSYNWTIYSAASVDYIELAMTARADTYVGFGACPTLMDGPIVACYVSPAGGAQCSDWAGSGVAVAPKSASTAIVSWQRSGAGYVITVRATTTSFGISKASPQRAIFAVGVYNTASNMPTQHTAVERDAVLVNFYSGTGAAMPTVSPSVAPPPLAVAIANATVTPSAVVPILGGKLTYNWTIELNSLATTDDDVLSLTMVGATDTYMALGPSTSLMNGPMIACSMPPAGTAFCNDWTGSGLSILAATPRSVLTSWRRSAAGNSVTVRINAAAFGVTPFATQRVIGVGKSLLPSLSASAPAWPRCNTPPRTGWPRLSTSTRL